MMHPYLLHTIFAWRRGIQIIELLPAQDGDVCVSQDPLSFLTTHAPKGDIVMSHELNVINVNPSLYFK